MSSGYRFCCCSLLAHRRNDEVRIRAQAASGPALGDGFHPREETHALRPMLIRISEGRSLPTAETMIGERHGNGNVDADHACLDARGKFTRRIAVTREYCGAVSVLMRRGKRQGLVEIFCAHDLKDGTENLVPIGFHRWRHLIEERCAEVEAAFVALHCEAAAVDHEIRTFLHAKLDIVDHLPAMRLADKRPIRRFGLARQPHLQRLDAWP